MLVPLKWLKELVDYDLTAQELADMLTMSGLEVEGVVERFSNLDKVVAAKVLGVEPHPNADKLHLAQVDAGGEPVTIVCGAPNMREGMLSALALPGAVLGEGMEVKPVKIRGVQSHGMLCSERELGFSDDHSGIMDFSEGLTPGQNLVDALNLETQVLDISITPNRGDALCMLGVAREVAALLSLEVKEPEISYSTAGAPISERAQITVSDPDLCSRYAATMVHGIQIGPSPRWMTDRLAACGVRAINNIVDVTNYVMMERGQPLHAFDFANMAGGKVDVRRAGEIKKFTTLDNQEREMEHNMLMIWDGEKPVGLAGVMGGLNSEVKDHTTEVLIEAAFFNPISIRRTAKTLGLHSEASYRFERTVNLEGCMLAAKRAAQLMAQLSGGQVAPGELDIYPRPYIAPKLPLSVQNTAEFLGIRLSKDQTMRYLTRLGLSVEEKENGDSLLVEIPAFRPDLERPVDLTEEVARMVGYDRIPVVMPLAPISAKPRAWNQKIRDRARDLMSAQGFDEAINYSFAHEKDVDYMRLKADDPRRRVVGLLNPLSEDQAVLRTSLLPGMMLATRRNLGHRIEQLAIFEVGKVFISQGEKLPSEPSRLAAVISGLAEPVSWWAGERPATLAQIKGALNYLFAGLGLPRPVCEATGPVPPYLVPDVWGRVTLDGETIGEIGLINTDCAQAYDIDRAVYYMDLDFDRMVELAPKGRRFEHLPRFPEVQRDAAIVLDDAVGAGDLLDAAWALAGDKTKKWLVSVELFDLYRGKPLSKGQKSLGLRFTYRDNERTLTEKEIMPLHDKLVEGLLEKFRGTLRQ